jgi:hypothetical protein
MVFVISLTVEPPQLRGFRHFVENTLDVGPSVPAGRAPEVATTRSRPSVEVEEVSRPESMRPFSTSKTMQESVSSRLAFRTAL